MNERLQLIEQLNRMLLTDEPQYKTQAANFPGNLPAQRQLLRSLMNVRSPHLPLSQEFINLQDRLLTTENREKGIVSVDKLPAAADDNRLVLWQGDITRLAADAIVNAANSGLTGCYIPCHDCIDNCIHSAAGLALRAECQQIINRQGHPEPTGQARLTKGYNLPAGYILHTVGPIIDTTEPSQKQQQQLADCYRSCLKLAAANKLHSIAFCCISTGVFHFPHREAAKIAVHTVREFLKTETSVRKVIFNVFQDIDAEIYRHLLQTN